MRVKTDSSYSIRFRIASAIFALVMIQGLILVSGITFTGAIERNDIATYDILSNQSNSRKNEIQNILNTKRKNIASIATDLRESINKGVPRNIDSLRQTLADSDAEARLLGTFLEELISYTKYNSVTGAFVVLDATPEITDTNKKTRTSVYLRDSSPGIITGNNNNLLLEYGRVDISRNRDIAVNYLWSKDMDFSPGYNRDFYFMPINAALNAETMDARIHTYGYWSTPFLLKGNDVPIITYSLPLVLQDGTVYGVIGFELDTSYMSSLIPASEIPYNRGFYLLGATNDGEVIASDKRITSGAYAQHFLSGSDDSQSFSFEFVHENGKGSIYKIRNRERAAVAVGAYSEIGLYETFSPFYDEKWALICMAPEQSVMAGSTAVKRAISISIAISIVLAFVLALFVIMYIFTPIRRLSERISSIDPEKPVRFEKTNIREIDDLSGAFEILSDKVSESAAKMFKIIELVDLPLGSFEIDNENNRVKLSKTLYGLVEPDIGPDDSHGISANAWKSFIGTMSVVSVATNDEGITETLFNTGSAWDAKRWLRMRHITENMRDFGILIDVTDEVMQKQRLEFERNYDPLTKLLNRREFLNRALALKENNTNSIGVMMFADIDDLKFVNDSYGHETGDNYIKTFASFLNKFKELGAEVGRISGDEFVVFMCGFDTRQEARKAFDMVFADIRDLYITATDGTKVKLRASAGLSFYPDDSDDINQLIKYADYAMYEIKHSIKGEIQEFNEVSYNKNSFVISMKNMLDRLIDERKVSFAFQPIVDIKTGTVFAYEALMRSQVKEFKSPEDVLRVARSQAKLYQIEKLTFNLVLDWMEFNRESIRGKKIFINTLSNQLFIDSDMKEICEEYGHLFSDVVFEVAESEFSSKEDMRKKLDSFKDYGVMSALDDYGSGYSNELTLFVVEPDFIKMDISIVRDIDKDADKQQLVQSTIAYAANKDVKIIAEGVETHGELETLIRLGVDYVQGFYLAMPGFVVDDIPIEIKNEILALSSKQAPRRQQ